MEILLRNQGQFRRGGSAAPRRLAISLFFVVAAVGLGYFVSAEYDHSAVVLVVGSTALFFGFAALPFLMLRLRHATASGMSGVAFLSMMMAWLGIFFSTFIALRVGPNATLGDVFFVLAVLLVAVRHLHEGRRSVLIPGWLALSAGILSVSVVLSAFWSHSPIEDLVSGGRFVVALAVVPILISGSMKRGQGIRTSAWIFVLSVLVNASVGFLDFLGVSSFGPGITGLYFSNRATGFTLHPNHLGRMAAMAIPVAIVLASTTSTSLRRLLYLAAIGVLGLGVLVSGSRSAILMSLIGMAALFGLSPFLRRYAFLSVLIGGAIVIAALVRTPEEANLDVGIERLVGTESVDESNAFRVAQFEAAANDFYKRPFTGHGFVLVRQAHNIYLQLLQAGGILGLIAFLIFGGAIIRMGFRATRYRTQLETYHVLAAGLLASVVAWFVGGLVDNPLYDRFLYVPCGLLLALHYFLKNQEVPASN